MTRWIVFEPPGVSGQSAEALFLRDRFAPFAFLFTFLWLFRHRLWLAGIVVLALLVGFSVLGRIPGLAFAGAALPVLLGLIVALEGPSLRANRLRRRGWREAGVVLAADRTEAELRYYAGSSPSTVPDAIAAATAGRATPTRAPAASRAWNGLFTAPAPARGPGA